MAYIRFQPERSLGKSRGKKLAFHSLEFTRCVILTAKRVLISRSVIDSILTYGKMQYPREGILLLRGTSDKDKIHLNEVVVPPLATHGRGFSNFPLHMLPIDLSVMGTAHSHPSGVLHPSAGDLNHFYGKIMIITGYPYDSEEQIAVYDKLGNLIEYAIVDGE
jgi:proteasome lid subunit RPN8/RPN11